MDGNGRWARERNLPRTAGHREGVQRVREITKAAAELGIKVATFFAFSTENWARPKEEVGRLMKFLNNFLDKEVDELNKNNIRFRVIGREKPIPEDILDKIRDREALTKNNTALTMVLALNYGARQEIVDAAKKIAASAARGELSLESLSIEDFNKYLYTADLPEPDLLIRTSGEQRLSNFLLWQLCYAELYFVKKYWPDFRKEDLEEAIIDYQKRQRRFGAIEP